ncbi:transcriptional regulator, GntR family [Oryzomicrobium terrae]|uniref:Transcriptional regulator, GntR family n=2 Tax=Oryzomicrobium terrae TaxID=1735038 RepID=A0A5C1ECS7_9RHOO|nr:transcriptional regulator, GntR family [Oryzomicrobium terrae]
MNATTGGSERHPPTPREKKRNMTGHRIAQPALYEEVAERLRQRIFAHELKPGAWIDEQAIAEQYGISRTPLREALKVLASEGLVNLKPRRGCYVTELSPKDISDIFPLMALLEGRSAFEATERATDADRARLQALHDDLEQAARDGDIPRFFEANQEFHRTLQAITGNRWLLQVIQDLRKVLKLTRLHSLSAEGRLQQSLEEHRAILAAVLKGDPARAESLMRDHLLAGREAVTKNLPADTRAA